MRIWVQVIIESDQETAPLHIEEVACFERGTVESHKIVPIDLAGSLTKSCRSSCELFQLSPRL